MPTDTHIERWQVVRVHDLAQRERRACDDCGKRRLCTKLTLQAGARLRTTGWCIWWIGYRPGEVKTVEALGEALQEQGHALPATVKNKLLADQAAPREPGPMQRKLGFTG